MTRAARGILYALISMAVVTLVVGVVVSIILSTQTIAEVRKTQLTGTPQGKRLLASSDRVLDCTQAGGECYEENQRRTAAVVGDIAGSQQAAASAGAYCATHEPKPTTPAGMLRCVKAQMKAPRSGPTFPNRESNRTSQK